MDGISGISGAITGMLYILGGLAVVVLGGVATWFWLMRRGQMQGE